MLFIRKISHQLVDKHGILCSEMLHGSKVVLVSEVLEDSFHLFSLDEPSCALDA